MLSTDAVPQQPEDRDTVISPNNETLAAGALGATDRMLAPGATDGLSSCEYPNNKIVVDNHVCGGECGDPQSLAGNMKPVSEDKPESESHENIEADNSTLEHETNCETHVLIHDGATIAVSDADSASETQTSHKES